ncbi:WSC domain-containing protein [Cyathus striatus]|nr:WSC domain-containing protein [Cyathus striatus]
MELSLFIVSWLTIHYPYLAKAQLPDGWNSLGCFTDSSTRTLDAHSYASAEMTPQTCIAYCAARDFLYAGVEYARVYCDNVLHGPGAHTDSGCDMECTGDHSQICGGSNRINIYSSSTMAVAPAIKQTVGSWIYNGCRVDLFPRSLSYRLDIPSGSNSAEYCTSQCKEHGYALAGLEYGSECWCDNYIPYGELVDDSQCNMVCSGDHTELCGAGNRLVLYQDTAATPLSDSCLSGRDGSSFSNTGIQVIPKQGNAVRGIQMFANTLDPSTDGSIQHTVITSCRTCTSSSNDAPLYNFQLNDKVLSPHGLFGNPEALAPVVGEPLTFLGFSDTTLFAQFCAVPNPVSPEGSSIGFPLLSVGGRTDLWSVCPSKTSSGILTVVYSPVANHADYNLEDCRDVYLQLTPEYARTDV